MDNASDPTSWTIEAMAHWLGVAREIREAEMWGSAKPALRPDDPPHLTCKEITSYPGARREWLCGEDCPPTEPSVSSARIPMPVTTRDRETLERTQRIEAGLRIPLPESDATEVMTALRNCYSCGQTIAYDNAVLAWRHVASQQRVCAGVVDGDTLVYAWPSSVEAG